MLVVASAVAVLTEINHNGASNSNARVEAPTNIAEAAPHSTTDNAQLLAEIRQLRAELREDDVSDRVLENVWIQLLGLLGTGLIAASFLIEARQKYRERVVQQPE